MYCFLVSRTAIEDDFKPTIDFLKENLVKAEEEIRRLQDEAEENKMLKEKIGGMESQTALVVNENGQLRDELGHAKKTISRVKRFLSHIYR